MESTDEDINDFETLDMCHCDICWEYMLDREPKFLECHHTFCYKCLEQIVKNEKISCPTCRRQSTVRNNDISKLTSNFHLLKMRDELSEKWHKTPEICQICMTAKTAYKCKECAHGLCAQCTIKHNEIKNYKNHTVNPFCPDHPDSFIISLCKQCFKRLCRRCFPAHAEHEKYFESYDQGILSLQSRLTEYKLSVTQKIYEMNTCKTTDSEVISHVEKVKEYVESQGFSVEERNKEKEKLLAVIRKYNQHAEDVMDVYKETETNWTNLTEEIDKLMHATDVELLENFNQMTIHKEEELEKTWERLLPLPEEMVYLGQYRVLSPSVLTRLSWTEEATLKKDFHGTEGLELSRPQDIACHGKNSVLLIDKGLNIVMKVSNSSVRLSKFYFDPDKGPVQGLAVYGRNWYVLQQHCITEIPSNDTDNTVIYRPKIPFMQWLLVVNYHTFIIVNTPDGKLIEYNCKKDTETLKVSGLNVPTYISMGHTADGPIYVVTVKGDRNVHIYNHHWRLQFIVGVPGGPTANLVVPGGILIAEYDKHRISHFTESGKFICHRLTPKQGVKYPLGLAFSPPYLYVLERCKELSHYALRQFKVIIDK